MLKYRVIRSFVAVWCAVCLAYMGVRAAWGAIVGTDDENNMEAQTTPVVEENVEQVPPKPEGEPIAEPVAAPEEAEPAPEAEPEEVAEPAPAPEAEPEPQPEEVAEPIAAPEEADPSQPDDWPDDGDQWTQQTETLDIPSLEEYLSWYTCGSCRRNCSLANPHCHNGSRLAELKAQEYLSLYGLS